MDRFILTDAQWAKMQPRCLGKPGDPGRSGKNNRLFVEAVLWVVRTGSPWRDLPPAFGHWNSIFTRFRDWVKAGVWQRLFDAVSDEPDMEYALVDATIVKVHRHGQGAKILWGDGRLSIGRLGSGHLDQEAPMASAATPVSPAEIASATLFVALELSRSTWRVALHAPRTNKVSQHRLDGGDADGLLALITRKREQAEENLGQPVRVVCCFEAGYDGFWLHRWLGARGIENRVLDAASLLVNRRARRAKTDRPRCRGALAHPDGPGARRGPGLPGRARAHTSPVGCAPAIARA